MADRILEGSDAELFRLAQQQHSAAVLASEREFVRRCALLNLDLRNVEGVKHEGERVVISLREELDGNA